MLNRLLAFGLCFCLIIGLTACDLQFELPEFDYVFNFSDISVPQVSTENISSQNQSNTSSSNTTKSKIVQNASLENVISSPKLNSNDSPFAMQVTITKEEYFQYSTLNNSEKAIYNDICKAIESTKNVINLSKYNIDYEKMWGIFQKVIADNPQYFWVSKFIEYTHFNVGSKNKIIDLILFYTDGTVTDNISNNKLTTVASRKKIANQISQVNRVVEGIIENIPFWYSEIEKEYLIHDAVIELVTYDSDTANKEITRNNYTRIYDIYGAAVNEKAVCEGYSRLFQYLCYLVGINSTIVVGTANDEPHAWNAVQIDFYWYHTDVTWDENYIDYFSFVNYNNLTLKQITNDHDIDYSYLVVPATNGY